MTGSEPRRAGCSAAGVPRVETTVDCGVPPPPTPPGFASLPISPNFIADSTTCPLTRSPGFPGRIAILHPTDHIHVAHTRRIQSVEASQVQLSSQRNQCARPSNQRRKGRMHRLNNQTRLARILNPNRHGGLEPRGPSGGTSRFTGGEPYGNPRRDRCVSSWRAAGSPYGGSDCSTLSHSSSSEIPKSPIRLTSPLCERLVYLIMMPCFSANCSAFSQ